MKVFGHFLFRITSGIMIFIFFFINPALGGNLIIEVYGPETIEIVADHPAAWDDYGWAGNCADGSWRLISKTGTAVVLGMGEGWMDSSGGVAIGRNLNTTCNTWPLDNPPPVGYQLVGTCLHWTGIQNCGMPGYMWDTSCGSPPNVQYGCTYSTYYFYDTVHNSCSQTKTTYTQSVDCSTCTEASLVINGTSTVSCDTPNQNTGITDGTVYTSCYDSNNDGFVDNLIVKGSVPNAIPNCTTCEQKNTQSTFSTDKTAFTTGGDKIVFSGLLASEPIESWTITITGGGIQNIILSGSGSIFNQDWRGTDAFGNFLSAGEYKASLNAQTGTCTISKEQNIMISEPPNGGPQMCE